MDATSEIDPRLLARLDREVRRVRAAPDLTDALGECSKQFQLWDIDREELELEPARLDRLERTRPWESLGDGFQAIAADCTREVVRLVPASSLAGKGFETFQTLKRVVLAKPYKAADRAE